MLEPRNRTSYILISALVFGCSSSEDVVDLSKTLSISPSAVDFGEVTLGERVTQRVRLRNVGDTELAFDIAGGEGTAFDVIPPSVTLGPGRDTDIEVSFEPDTLGPQRETYDLTYGTFDVSGEGTSIDPCFTVVQTELDFQETLVNTTRTASIELQNDCTEELTARVTRGANVEPCSTSGTPLFCVPRGAVVVPPGATRQLDVSFTPTREGRTERGNFTIWWCNDSLCARTITLVGDGTSERLRCPNEIQFGPTMTSTCATEVARCENPVNVDLAIDRWRLFSAGDVLQAPPTREVVVAPGETFDLPITFCPDQLGHYSGELLVEQPHPDPQRRTLRIPIRADACEPALTITPNLVDFGEASLVAPVRRSILVRNDGAGPVAIEDVVSDTEGTGAFIVAERGSSLLQAGESTEIVVEFLPLTEGEVHTSVLLETSEGCDSTRQIKLAGRGVNLPPCAFDITPMEVELSAAIGESSRRAFLVRNNGAGTCLVSRVNIAPGTSSAFSLPDGDLQSVRIDAGAAKTIHVAYAPQSAAPIGGFVELQLNNPNTPLVQVRLSGTAFSAGLEITPPVVDFGEIVNGCTTRSRDILLTNLGSTPAQVSSIALAPPASEFTLARLPTLPFSIAPGGSLSFGTHFGPSAVSEFASAIEIDTTFGGLPITQIVSLTGTGRTAGDYVDRFVTPPTIAADFLFVVGRSIFMTTKQTALGQSFGNFLLNANNIGVDYRIGVTSASRRNEGGRLVHPASSDDLFGGPVTNKIITPATPQVHQVFQTNTALGRSRPGHATDHEGLEAMYLALTAPNITGPNAGFLRPNVPLLVVFVVDEEDESANSVAFYANFLAGLKDPSRPDLISVAAIVGPTPAGCNGPNGPATAGQRYLELAMMLDGNAYDVCGNLAPAMSELPLFALDYARRYPLSQWPVPDSIQITADGVEVPRMTVNGQLNWLWDSLGNTIVFQPVATPPAGSNIEVTYTGECL